MARAAAVTALLDRELKKLDGTNVKAAKSTRDLTDDQRGIPALGGPRTQRATTDINKLSGRLELLGAAVGSVGPGLIPLGGVGIGSFIGLSNSIGVSIGAVGAAVLAFHGLGTALTAINKAQLEPTQANLTKMQEVLATLPPAAQDFARELAGMTPLLDRLRASAASGIFPGLSQSLGDLTQMAPEVQRILHGISSTLGGLAAEGTANLGSRRWTEFFEFLRKDAAPTLAALGTSLGHVVAGMASLWQAFAPLNTSFSAWLMRTAQGFDHWAEGLSKTQGFQDFLAYVHQTGPEVAQLLGSLANALVQIVQAAAPIGGPVLHALTAFADVIAKIADSDIGTPLFVFISAMSTLRLATAAYEKVSTSAFGGRLTGQLRATQGALGGVITAQERATMSASEMQAAQARAATASKAGFIAMGKSAGQLGALALVSTGAAGKLGVANTASGALLGSLIGKGAYGAVAGGLVGAVADLNNALGMSASSAQSYATSVQAAAGPGIAAQIKATKDALAGLDTNAPGPDFSAFGAHIAPFATGTEWRDADAKAGALTASLAQLEQQQILNDAADAAQARSVAVAKSAMVDYSRSIYANMAAMRARREENNRTFSAETAYHAALLDSEDAVKKNGKTLNLNTRAGLANREALESQASAWNALSDTAKATPGAFASARKALYDTARAMGASKDQAHAYVRQLLQVPKKIDTQVHLDLLAAQGALNSFYRTWDGRVIHMRGEVGMATPDVRVARASGGPVYGPGSATSDSIPAWLSNGEYVMRAAAVDRYGLRMMHEMNALRLSNGGYAAGAASRTTNNYYPADAASSGPSTAYFSDDAVKFMTAAVVAAIQRDATKLSAARRS